MKRYINDDIVLSVVRCAADRYIINNLGIKQNATVSKEVAQSFLDSWAGKRKLQAVDDLDVDMYNDKPGNNNVCKFCIAYRNGQCGRQ